MYNSNSSPTLTQVIFTANKASSTGAGGGMYNAGSSSPKLTQVIFFANRGGFGGGLYNFSSSAELRQVMFIGNSVTSSGNGGGMHSAFNSSSTVINSIFWGNFKADVTTTKNQIYMGPIGNSLNIYYSIVEGANDTARFLRNAGTTPPTIMQLGMVSTSDVKLVDQALVLFPGAPSITIKTISAGSPAINAGLYIQKNGRTHYYSEDASAWYTGLSGTATLPSGAINLTEKDITDYTRTNRPDIGAYEVR